MHRFEVILRRGIIVDLKDAKSIQLLRTHLLGGELRDGLVRVVLRLQPWVRSAALECAHVLLHPVVDTHLLGSYADVVHQSFHGTLRPTLDVPELHPRFLSWIKCPNGAILHQTMRLDQRPVLEANIDFDDSRAAQHRPVNLVQGAPALMKLD